MFRYRGAVCRVVDPLYPINTSVRTAEFSSYPANTAPPKAMVDVAKRFLYYYVDMVLAAQDDPYLDDEVIDQQVDVTLDEWIAWTGKAFNQALDELGLTNS